jgi:phosphoribosyl 1,2-cyclic phosphodiesterase
MQLASGRPRRLQDRIMGGSGHLSNEQALALASRVHRAHPLSAVLLVHLSRQCNCPRLVERLWAGAEPGLHAKLTVTAQDRPSPPVAVAPRAEHATLFDA